MRIGILTLHSNTNFGGSLQQIALYETMKSMGHEPCFLCVRNDSHLSMTKKMVGILTSYSPIQLMNASKEAVQRLFKTKIQITPNYNLYKKTDDFNYSVLNYTPKFSLHELPDYVSTCDALIFGSDQIWTDVYSDVLPYFGDGIPAYKGKKIAFAACSAHEHIPAYNRKKIKNLLLDFDAISARDDTTRKLVKYYSGIDAPIVCDPTLLYDFQPYLKTYPIKDDYIFAYVLGDKSSEWHSHNIEKIKKETGLSKVVALTTSLDERFPWADIIITDALAVDWMNILRKSSFVYTNSFHAVIFSLKFHRNFVAYYGDLVRSSRMLALRKQFCLEDRIVKQPSAVDFRNFLNFSISDQLLDKLTKISISFLSDAINADVLI